MDATKLWIKARVEQSKYMNKKQSKYTNKKQSK